MAESGPHYGKDLNPHELRGMKLDSGVADLIKEIVRLRAALRELYDDACVDDIDPRLKYVVLQVGRSVWEKVERAAERIEETKDA